MFEVKIYGYLFAIVNGEKIMKKYFKIIPVFLTAAFILLCPRPVFATEAMISAEQMAEISAAQAAAQQAQQAQINALNQQLADLNKAAMDAQAAAAAQAAQQQKALEQQQKAALKAAEEQAKAAQAAAAQQAELAQAAAAQKAAEDAAAASGMTYVDISLDNQTLTYFVNGVPAITTPCVTGGPKNGTPRGVFAINTKTPGKYLTGPTWHVWVNRWMRFCGNVGIHDASWRKKFGGNIYKSNGSHGCVNIPGNVANQLYNMVGIGTVVIVH